MPARRFSIVFSSKRPRNTLPGNCGRFTRGTSRSNASRSLDVSTKLSNIYLPLKIAVSSAYFRRFKFECGNIGANNNLVVSVRVLAISFIGARVRDFNLEKVLG